MSANNWGVCPKCREKAEQAHADLLSRIETDYGKVTATEYLELIEQSKQLIGLKEHTLREDYEIGIRKGEFHISYGAYCEECSFFYKFEHKEKI